MKKIQFGKNGDQLLYLKITNYITKQIESGVYPQNRRLPSINEFSSKNGVSRDTTEKAYKLLIQRGYIIPVSRKGYFVNKGKQAKLKVLFILNKLSSYKKIVYYSFLETLGRQANVDLQIHHYDPKLLNEILETNTGQYHYYVVMPHFFTGADPAVYRKVLAKIPAEQLLLLDKQLPDFKNSMSVYQDFEKDIYDGLTTAVPGLHKYKKIVLVFPENDNHPTGIIAGVERFCKLHRKTFKQVAEAKTKISKGAVYIFVTEDDLAIFIKKVRQTGLVPGKDVGIISFNETIFKELLGITVMTTDFEQMGRSAAQLILENKQAAVRNNFKFIQRDSL